MMSEQMLNSSPVTVLFNSVQELINPFQAVIKRVLNPWDDIHTRTFRNLDADLMLIAAYLIQSDDNISDDEAALLLNIKQSLAAENNEHDTLTWDVHRFRDYFRSLRDEWHIHPEPSYISCLEIYDRRHGTDYSEKAKGMYYRFGEAIMSADGEVTQQEEYMLTRLKGLLFAPTCYTDSPGETAGDLLT